MARLLHEIEWGEPLLKPRSEADYEEELVKRLNPWLAAAVRSLSEPEKVSYAPLDLVGVAYFVASQENACRYCYGTARALMKIWGYSERQIQDLEHEASLAGGRTRRAVEFARKLAKSNPSPARDDFELLHREGLSREAVSEIAGSVVKACFANRMSTFLALPPNKTIEKLSNTLLGRLIGFVIWRGTAPRKAPPPRAFINRGPCAATIAAAGQTHYAVWLRGLTDGWLASPAIPRRSNLLMLAVIARQLGAQLAEMEAREALVAEVLPEAEIETILATLDSPTLTAFEARLLRWIRETVWYEPRIIQDSTRRLAGTVGEELAVEAIGSAAVCNTLARLSLVRQ